MALLSKHAVQHVFVLMLENRSFDHMFALSGIHGITAATAANSCPSPQGAPIAFFGPAPESMPKDPGHEFCDVVVQLCGPGVTFPNSHVYPPINNQGFVANYAKAFKTPAPARADVVTIMAGVHSPTQIPALHALATNYMLCDHWFSSLPGATWPNRFFVHGASSAGLDHSPGAADIAIWETIKGFRYPNGSIFDRLGAGNFRLYQDKSGPIAGQIPQVAALHGIHGGDVHDVAGLAGDLAGNYPYAYTFIEPAYGDILFSSYRRGSSQHPCDGLAPGDRLAARVYNAIRQSPLWSKSLLVITYDEHGGFFDHVAPHKAPAPGDNPPPRHNKTGFDFTLYGVRVPAIVISPWVAKGGVDAAPHDHASIAATLTDLFGIVPLTQRDQSATPVTSLFIEVPRADGDCPEMVTGAAAPVAAAAMPIPAQNLAQPIPEGSNLQAFLYVLRKTHEEASDHPDNLMAQAMRVPQPALATTTIGQAKAYIEAMAPHLVGAK